MKQTSSPYPFGTPKWTRWLAGYISWTPSAEPAEPDNAAYMEGFDAAARKRDVRKQILVHS